ncbi:TrkH family potassium uptake protein [Butyrivibrio sp. MC2013]|uniref:TrkH family potassium uptake protein n=1 Tax=Butyrivibrio sp. MC2013 TaxID=1280686 RepID=UPI0004288DEA|nr:TrkH family potassium uptake protein [Butyrivibrio sp. MC2013]
MNYDAIKYVLLRLIRLMGALLVPPLLVCLYYREWIDAAIFAAVAAVCILIGYVTAIKGKTEGKAFYAREGLVITAFAWIIFSLIGAIPFSLTGSTDNYLDSVFETVSGFTTTGSTIMTDPSVLGHGIQFWRCFTHWVGGMGILVFLLTIMPMTGGYSMHLMRAESPGPTVGKYVPKVKDTAKILYGIYIGITVTETILLMISGLSLYEALCVTFSTVGTGGFGLYPASCGVYSVASRTIITVFMAMCGINFSVYYFLLKRKWKEAWNCDEMRFYLMTIFASALLISWNAMRAGIFDAFGEAFHHSLFTVTSIMTTTGFASIDYNGWPQFSRTLIIILTFVGACAGSTGGGFKISRIVILVKNARNEIHRAIHPKSVHKVNMDGHVVEEDTVRSVSAYLAIYVMVFLISFLLVAFFESISVIDMERFDFETNLTAVAATLNNVGPGLNLVGPAGGFHDFTWASKIVLIFDMLAGRLELMPILILGSRHTWRK